MLMLLMVVVNEQNTSKPAEHASKSVMIGDTEILARLLHGYNSRQRPRGQEPDRGGAQ